MSVKSVSMAVGVTVSFSHKELNLDVPVSKNMIICQ